MIHKKDHLSLNTLKKKEIVFWSEFKKLNKNNKNIVRGLLGETDSKIKLKILNKVRKNESVNNIGLIFSTLEKIQEPDLKIVPDFFPKEAKIFNDIAPMSSIDLEKQISVINIFFEKNLKKILSFLKDLTSLNEDILNEKFIDAEKKLEIIYQNYGYSHIFLRKLIFLKETCIDSDIKLFFIQKFLHEYNNSGKNLIVGSLQLCYQNNGDYLTLKRSVLHRKEKNIFCKNISYIPFSFFVENNNIEISNILLNHLQSSLIDSFLFIYFNANNFPINLNNFNAFTNISIQYKAMVNHLSIENLARFYINYYDQESEELLFKQSSAWYEIPYIYNYRLLQDSFYDSYKTPLNNDSLNNWIKDLDFNSLAENIDLTLHNFPSLKKLEINGAITHSSIFNYILEKTEGDITVLSKNLYKIMGMTQDLAKTVEAKYLVKMAQNTSCLEQKIILYLLISKKMNSVSHTHKLRKYIQEIVISDHNSDLVSFVKFLATKSIAVAEYTYEICTEDFIANLAYIIPNTLKITQTRAELHEWMGQQRNDPTYLNKARNLIIDHKINKIRNVIDDNRIYVDSVKFSEWISDSILNELNGLLSSLEQNSILNFNEVPQLRDLIEKVYYEFCSNKNFGISSYLGRRIRHGTFKGHLFYKIIRNIKLKYKNTINDPIFFRKWSTWEQEYESIINSIINDHLHVNSSQKKLGLIKPDLILEKKYQIALNCSEDIITEYKNSGSLNLGTLLVEYCWRLIAIDLISVNAFLKKKKKEITEQIDNFFPNTEQISGDLQRNIGENFLTIYEWFKKPHSVAPKVNLNLLFKAVIQEVKETYPKFCNDLSDNFSKNQDQIELLGGVYHIIYDALYIVIYNAAEHGRENQIFEADYSLSPDFKKLIVKVISEIKDSDHIEEINCRLNININDKENIENAQLTEGKSGIYKLYNLMSYDKNFKIEYLKCREDRKVQVIFSYELKQVY